MPDGGTLYRPARDGVPSYVRRPGDADKLDQILLTASAGRVKSHVDGILFAPKFCGVFVLRYSRARPGSLLLHRLL